MTKCSALKCKNIGVHLFPKDEKRRKKWESALRIENFKASNTSRLCAAHFTEEDYFGQSRYTNYKPRAKFLRKTAVPSIFSFTTKIKENPVALTRQRRLGKRTRNKLSVESHKSDPLGSPSSFTEETPRDPLLSIEGETKVISRQNRIAALSTPKYVSVSTQVHNLVYGSIDRYRNNDAFIKFSTGFESYKKFYSVYSTLSPMVHKISYENTIINLSTEDQFFLTMMKLWQNKCNYELSMFYDISESTVSTIFETWVNFMYKIWGKIDVWPKDEIIHYYMPKLFKHFVLNIEVMSGGTQIKVDRVKNPKSNEVISSSHKDTNSSRIIVGAILGLISGQSISEQNNRVTKSKTGGNMIDDKVFLAVQDVFPDKSMPTNTSEHIERIIGLSNTFKILQQALDHNYVPIACKIFFACFMCCYFKEGSMRKNVK